MSSSINYHSLLADLHIYAEDNPQLAQWLQRLPAQIAEGLSPERWGDLPQWQQVLDALSAMDLPTFSDTPSPSVDLVNGVSIGQAEHSDNATRELLRQHLMGLHPWRKGPYELFGLTIDTEWRSDWKWDRVLPHLSPLQDRLILDVGCGNGYHCWRMLGAGAKRVIGIDPSCKFVYQFYALKHFLGDLPVDVLPLGIEQVPDNLQLFDTVFSMGVLYHRRSPMDHLRELKSCLRPGGELVLETLIIDGGLGQVLVPEGRYAKMRNVWFLPSAETLISWLKKCGFKNPRLVDKSITTIDEQRATDWMTFESLPDFLDPNDQNKTIEGHPAPIRAVVVAQSS